MPMFFAENEESGEGGFKDFKVVTLEVFEGCLSATRGDKVQSDRVRRAARQLGVEGVRYRAFEPLEAFRGQARYERRYIHAGPRHACVYCTGPAQALDHVPPISAADWFPASFPFRFYTACQGCNSTLRAFSDTCLVARAAFLLAALCRRECSDDLDRRFARRASGLIDAVQGGELVQVCECPRCVVYRQRFSDDQ